MQDLFLRIAFQKVFGSFLSKIFILKRKSYLNYKASIQSLHVDLQLRKGDLLTN